MEDERAEVPGQAFKQGDRIWQRFALPQAMSLL